jgi:hypothetical protein
MLVQSKYVNPVDSRSQRRISCVRRHYVFRRSAKDKPATTPGDRQLGRPVVVAAQRRGVRVGFASIAAGLLIAAAGMLVAHVGSLSEVVFVDFTAILISIGVGSAVGTVVREDARQKSQVRFARLRSVGVSDYRSAPERWAPRIAVLLALAAFVFRLIIAPGSLGGTPIFLLIYAGGMVLSLALCETGSRLLVRRGQPAGSALELAWDDALRSRALNGIALAPLYLGAYFNIATVAFYPPTRGDGAAVAVQLSSILELLFAACLFAWAIFAGRTKPQQRYLRRLWPELIPVSAAVPVQTAPAPQS